MEQAVLNMNHRVNPRVIIRQHIDQLDIKPLTPHELRRIQVALEGTAVEDAFNRLNAQAGRVLLGMVLDKT